MPGNLLRQPEDGNTPRVALSSLPYAPNVGFGSKAVDRALADRLRL